MIRNISIFLALCFAALSAFANPAPLPPKYAVGFNVDLLPTILSASESEFGYSVQGWFGIDNVRLRLVGAHLAIPQMFFGDDTFRHLRSNVGALICDYTTGDHFDKLWLGSGFEIWRQSIEHSKGSHPRASWTNYVFTVGGGYIYRFGHGFYIDPWAAGHFVLTRKSITLYQDHFTPRSFQSEVSVKLGWSFDL